ncbi:MAG: hypothetical protein K6T83_17075, partial [Alicyclobacillus sp.]|nr:hypothetical protein [Alicyclobacillus sp.]
ERVEGVERMAELLASALFDFEGLRVVVRGGGRGLGRGMGDALKSPARLNRGGPVARRTGY